jgi:hypothetical protein
MSAWCLILVQPTENFKVCIYRYIQGSAWFLYTYDQAWRYVPVDEFIQRYLVRSSPITAGEVASRCDNY